MNRTMAMVALAVLAGFLGILVWKVPRLDLVTVVGVTFLLAAWDIWQTSGSRKR
ncbi:MAG: hypothetical protein KF887_13740 [Paracoccaceae bacterium]|nr:MAG: hypothetical protein KF887_13740 [Paracoccaceae bacterium]